MCYLKQYFKDFFTCTADNLRQESSYSVLTRPAVLVSGDMLDEVTAIVDGYNAYFSFSKVKTGYSGERPFSYSVRCCCSLCKMVIMTKANLSQA